MVANTVEVGDEFGMYIADGVERFRVTKITDRTVFAIGLPDHVVISGRRINIASHSGKTREFAKSEVLGCLRAEKASRHTVSKQEKFWNDQKVGTVLHYSHSFDKFVRGHVAVVHGRNQFVPDELVGAWDSHELPRRTATGEVDNGYFADKIAAGEQCAWTPHYGTIFESADHADDKFDPRTASAISLALPEQTSDERRESNREKSLRDIARIADDQTVSANERLAAIAHKLAAHLAEG